MPTTAIGQHIARLYERRVDRWPSLSDPERARPLQPPATPASRVVQVLMRLVECHGCPTQLRTDNGPEFISARLSEWCEQQRTVLQRIQPGKPTQNAYIERLNGSCRRELLDAHLFRSLAHVRQLVSEWMHDDNTQRPHP